MTSYIPTNINIELRNIDSLKYDKFIRYIVNKERVKCFNNFFLDLLSEINEIDNFKNEIPEKMISKIFFSALSLYKYHKNILEIEVNRHDKLIHNISKKTIESLYSEPKSFFLNMNIFYREFNIWKKIDLEYQMKQCTKSSETYSKIKSITSESSESKEIYDESLGKIKKQIDNYIKVLNKFKS